MPSKDYEPLSTAEDGFHDGQDDLETVDVEQDAKRPMPFVYYNDGPFDPPSSDSEDETLLEKGPDSPGAAEQANLLATRRPTPLRCLLICLCSLVLMAILIGVMAASSYSGTSYRYARGSKHITMDHVFNGTFFARAQGIRWVPEAGDGVFAITENNVIKLVDLKTNTTTELAALSDIKRWSDGSTLYISEWKLSPDMKYLLVKTDYKKQWRHSSFGNYYIHNIASQSTRPLIDPTYPPITAYATWAPTGEAIAYVASNDLYILPSPVPETAPIRITTSGNSSLFHGVPDWVYEEEVFSSDFALWWAPDASKVAFLRLDETSVPEYTYPVYNPSEDSYKVYPYTSDIAMKYPKPGYDNPLVSVHVFDLHRYQERQSAGDVIGFPEEDATRTLEWEGRMMVNDSVVMEVTWVANDSLIVKEVNRAADKGSVVFFDLDKAKNAGAGEVFGEVVRKLGKEGEEGDDGWIESNQYIYPIPETLTGGISSYLDIVNNSAGYNHIALFSPADSGEPVFVTDGEWEVTSGILGVDMGGNVYFTASNPSSTERNIFSVPLPIHQSGLTSAVSASSPGINITSLTDTAQPNYFAADFSPQAGFYLLSYQGPNVPWQQVMQTQRQSESTDAEKDAEKGAEKGDLVVYPVTDNKKLNETLREFLMPIVSWGTVESDGFDLNVMEIRPPNFDDTGRTKYPVLFRVYGGPGSQMVHTRFERDWHTYLACSLKYVIVVVDGRGTGFKGRKLRNPVRGNLGFWEVRDQVNAARTWAAKPYVDPKRIGIWGWSYGGFMSSKVVEADAGIHTLAMAVAPVTSWRLYDSIYTERYMGLPDSNPGGYVNASIANVTGFHNADFLLAHGSGDDNVHYANSAHLLDMFTRAQVRRFRFRMFTDSDHSIGRRGAYRELHEYMTDFLLEKWGKGGTRRGW